MSAYENVVKGRLKLKGKALDCISRKKKKKQKINHNTIPSLSKALSTEEAEAVSEFDARKDEAVNVTVDNDYLTPAERRYLQHWEKIDRQRLAKMATKSHRDRIHEFNQYLANLTEHYDIPKVGPG